MKTEILNLIRKALIILAVEVIFYFTITAAWGDESDVSNFKYNDTSVQDYTFRDASDVDDNDPTPTMTPTPTMSPTPTMTPTPTPTPTITPTPALHPEVLDFYDDVKKEITAVKETEFKIMVSIWALVGLLAGMKIQRMVFG